VNAIDSLKDVRPFPAAKKGSQMNAKDNINE
jgi:hypothetical protein